MVLFLSTAVIAGNLTKHFSRLSKQMLYLHCHRRWKANVISGRSIANVMYEQLKKDIMSMVSKGHKPPLLTTIVVGDNFASHLYIKNKMIAAKSIGIITREVLLDGSVSEMELSKLIQSLNKNPEVNAILVQLPLPDHISEQTISNIISPIKDVDGFNSENMGRFCQNLKATIPCTALAVREIICQTGIVTKGKHAVVCGRSKNVGMTIAMILHSHSKGESLGLDATTTICHRFTPHEELKRLSRSADILVSATGVPNLIGPDMVKEGGCVIDVGISHTLDPVSGKYKILGDVDFEGVKEVASFITPVPGGVGPLTVAMLLRNTLDITKQQHNLCVPNQIERNCK